MFAASSQEALAQRPSPCRPLHPSTPRRAAGGLPGVPTAEAPPRGEGWAPLGLEQLRLDLFVVGGVSV